MKKLLPVGYEDIREIADRNLYYVDKSLMIQRFFEQERNEEGIKTDNSDIFQNLQIAHCQEICRNYQQKYPVHEDITYGDIEESKDNLWNFLFFTGYLKKIKEVYEEGNIYFWLVIPNEEIRYIYRSSVLTWFQQKASQRSWN